MCYLLVVSVSRIYMDQNDETSKHGSKAGKPYDLTMVYAISSGNPEFLKKLISLFSSSVAADIKILKEAAQQDNWKEVASIAHKIKSSIAHFGIDSLKDIIINLEHQGDRSAEELNFLVHQLDAVINDVLFNLEIEFPACF